ncbi:MAG: hypothetical protein QW512_02095 [Thermofilaceae archaeon]
MLREARRQVASVFGRSDVAGLLLLSRLLVLRNFRSSSYIPVRMLSMLYDYVKWLLVPEELRSVGVPAVEVYEYDYDYDGNLFHLSFYAVEHPRYGSIAEFDDRRLMGFEVGSVLVDAGRMEVLGARYNADLTTLEGFKRLVERVGVVAYSIAKALLDTLPNNPMCAKSERCLEYLKFLSEAVGGVGERFEVDPRVYKQVRDVVERGALPFETSTQLEEDDYSRLENALSKVHGAAGLEGVELQNLRRFTVAVGGDLLAEVSPYWHSLGSPFTMVFTDRSGSFRVDVIFRTGYGFGFEGYYLIIELLDVSLRGVSLDRVAEVLGNWFEYVRRALEALAEWSKSGGLPPRTAEALASYLRAWTAVLEKHRSELEKNRVVKTGW